MSMSTHSLLDTETSESRAAIRYFSRLFCFAQFLFNLILMPVDHYIFNPGQQLLNQFVLILFECLIAGNLNIFLPVLHSDGYIYLKRSRQLYSRQHIRWYAPVQNVANSLYQLNKSNYLVYNNKVDKVDSCIYDRLQCRQLYQINAMKINVPICTGVWKDLSSEWYCQCQLKVLHERLKYFFSVEKR